MVVLGHENTLPVTVDDIIYHTRAVARGNQNALIVGDMPFMSYQTSVYDCVVNAGRIIKEGMAHAVKLEGGVDVAEHVKALVAASIPVVGHIGMTPQSVNAFGSFKVQGKDKARAVQIIEDALALQEAGAFAIVLECIPAELSRIITQKLGIPTIGIGAGLDCDGQVLVYSDMLGINVMGFKPKFVKQYAQLSDDITSAFATFKQEVENGSFPTQEHSFKIDADIIQEIAKEFK
jgi:3-methyl-2-oxobutanoate hydroxymethyltransferase